jgi:hypothetical protein
MPIVITPARAQPGCTWAEILVNHNFVTGHAEARRLLGIGAVRLNGYTVGPQDRWDGHDADVLAVGRKSFYLHPMVCNDTDKEPA